jgi:WD40 repeat protein
MFSCVESDSDDDVPVIRSIQAARAALPAFVLPPPELISDHGSAVYSVMITHFGDIITGGCGEMYINRYGEFEETSNVKGILCGYEKIYALVVLYGVEPMFYSAHNDGQLRSWNLLSRTPLMSITAHGGSILGMTTLQGAEPVLITSSVDGNVFFWSPELKKLAELPLSDSAILAICAQWQGESSIVISGLADGRAQMWMYSPPHTTMKLREIAYSESSVRSIAMAQSIFVLGRYDGTIEVRDIRTGKINFCLEGHVDVVRSLDIYEGSFPALISGSYDQTICVWNLATGSRLQILRGHTEDVTCVAVSKGPKPFVVSGSKDWLVKVWDIAGIVRGPAA